MICKQCGKNLTKYERFCPYCGSYFIAAEDDTDGRMWKGIITESGSLDADIVINSNPAKPASGSSVSQSNAKSRSSKNSSPKAKSKRVWGIIGFSVAAFTLICNILEHFLTGSDIEFFGFFVFPLAVIGAIIGFKSKFGKFAWILIIAAIVIFFNT